MSYSAKVFTGLILLAILVLDNTTGSFVQSLLNGTQAIQVINDNTGIVKGMATKLNELFVVQSSNSNITRYTWNGSSFIQTGNIPVPKLIYPDCLTYSPLDDSLYVVNRWFPSAIYRVHLYNNSVSSYYISSDPYVYIYHLSLTHSNTLLVSYWNQIAITVV